MPLSVITKLSDCFYYVSTFLAFNANLPIDRQTGLKYAVFVFVTYTEIDTIIPYL